MELVVATVPAIHNDALLDVGLDEKWELEGAAALDGAERVGVKRELHNLQEKYCAKRQIVLASVAKALTSACEQLGTID